MSIIHFGSSLTLHLEFLARTSCRSLTQVPHLTTLHPSGMLVRPRVGGKKTKPGHRGSKSPSILAASAVSREENFGLGVQSRIDANFQRTSDSHARGFCSIFACFCSRSSGSNACNIGFLDVVFNYAIISFMQRDMTLLPSIVPLRTPYLYFGVRPSFGWSSCLDVDGVVGGSGHWDLHCRPVAIVYAPHDDATMISF
ncbi:hypothetical protein GALMADRAFT_1346315 [Galerina marginata CBS 339.88]|uniref:Uncharacterized protein n=1 Tax=Galerina marginata (strain CBS 339.88) TaxID=685588 RepID=A0A067SIJ8_GALM3|nr:hypothetical protein GALMADRAFT_1346315 [Galerina marginata CBS 339.88]